jgi:hypothetical protein
MKLTEDQIQELYRFTQQHFVEWYDLQTELVDHLANDIESILTNNPSLTFNEAKDKSFKKFGICGFQDVVIKKQKALRKKYWKLVWHFFKDYFKLPKIILTIVLTSFVHDLLNLSFFNKDLLLGLLLVYLLILFSIIIYMKRQLKSHQKTTGKKWIFEQVTYTLGGSFILFQFVLQILIDIHGLEIINFYYRLGFALFFVLSGFFFYIAIKIIPLKMEETIIKEYPEYNKLQKA